MFFIFLFCIGVLLSKNIINIFVSYGQGVRKS